jgi:hypothetical protein
MRYASRIQHYLALKNEIFSSTDRVFYKNAQIFTTVRIALRDRERAINCNGKRYGTVLWIKSDSLL